MESHKRLSEILIETGAYKDLDVPVILTSGELGIYYMNTEKVVQDGGKFNEYGHSATLMVNHAVAMMNAHPTFREVIDILAEKVDSLFPKEAKTKAISGGQRRDWLFSGPIAHVLGLPHFGIYKDENHGIDIMAPFDGTPFPKVAGTYVIHPVDLITEASSCYRVEDGVEKGWVPRLRREGAHINDLIAVVNRQQGGRERLAALNPPVNTTSFVFLDQDFVKEHSNNPDRAVAYMANPRGWVENYLREHGALFLVDNFDPNGKNFDRAQKFITRYGDFLKSIGRYEARYEELNKAVQEKYGKTIDNK